MKIEPLGEALELIDCEPAGLAEVVAVRLAAYLLPSAEPRKAEA
jgi:hypothetical protein